MKKSSFLASILVALVFVTIARADSSVIFVKSATIAETKANGTSSWDIKIGVGKKAWPDPFVRIRVYDGDGSLADVGESAVIHDTFTPTWGQEIVSVKPEQKIKLEVWDKDASEDDLIGREELTLTAAMIKQGAITLQFGQVRSLHLEIRAVKQKSAAVSRILLQQSHPGPHSDKQMRRTPGGSLAVILLHGYDGRDDGFSPYEPRLHGWQCSASPLVKALAKDADVFAVSYIQTTAVEEVATFPELRAVVHEVAKKGYKELALVGHSSGGLVARHLVEDYPEVPVTRLIVVATPMAGSAWAHLGVKLLQVRREQAKFANSLTPTHRAKLLASRKEKAISKSVDFVAVVAIAAPREIGDGVLGRRQQWDAELQRQRIPCVPVQATHGDAMVHDDCIEVIRSLVKSKQPRWNEAQVQSMRRELGLYGQ